MTLYTRRGDTGTTSLADGTCVGKNDLRVEAYGAVDEANCAVGLALAATDDQLLGTWLVFLQQRLFNCSASLADPTDAASAPDSDGVTAVETAIDRLEAGSAVLRGFVLPGGCETAARLDVARATVRRAERCTDALAATQPVEPTVLAFLNRASDLLFAAARYANTLAGTPERLWDASAPEPEPRPAREHEPGGSV